MYKMDVLGEIGYGEFQVKELELSPEPQPASKLNPKVAQTGQSLVGSNSIQNTTITCPGNGTAVSSLERLRPAELLSTGIARPFQIDISFSRHALQSLGAHNSADTTRQRHRYGDDFEQLHNSD